MVEPPDTCIPEGNHPGRSSVIHGPQPARHIMWFELGHLQQLVNLSGGITASNPDRSTVFKGEPARYIMWF